MKKAASKKAAPAKKSAKKTAAKKAPAEKKAAAPEQPQLALVDDDSPQPVNDTKQKAALDPRIAEARALLRPIAIVGRKICLAHVVERLGIPEWMASRAYNDEVATVRESLALTPRRTRAKNA